MQDNNTLTVNATVQEMLNCILFWTSVTLLASLLSLTLLSAFVNLLLCSISCSSSTTGLKFTRMDVMNSSRIHSIFLFSKRAGQLDILFFPQSLGCDLHCFLPYRCCNIKLGILV